MSTSPKSDIISPKTATMMRRTRSVKYHLWGESFDG